MSQFEVTVELAAAKKLTGKEKLMLNVGGVTSNAVGLRDVEDCIDG